MVYERREGIPNYEKRPEPLLYQRPLAPEDSLKYTQVPVGFRLELFAGEPDVVNPISMAWDARGRLWVAETVDYPNELSRDRVGRDRIKILEDTDGDGRCDKTTVFVDGLNVPTSIVFANGGVIVAHAPDFLFFQDLDGDDRADTRETLITGWGVGDTHAGPSNLRYGLDNRVWGAVGYSRFQGVVAGRPRDFGSGVFRLEQDGSDIEFIAQFNNNTWGLGFNAAGDVFGSTANNNPSFFCGFPAEAYGTGREAGASAKMIADSSAFHPITPNVRQVDAFGAYTAGAGHALAVSAAFPEAWRDRMAFVCGPTGHLLGKFRLRPDGAGYAAENAFALAASADEWFSPVAAEVGPDGHLWIADWYNFIIQHNPTPTAERGGYRAERGAGNAHVNPNRDRRHGRIYRLIWEGAPESELTTLAGADTQRLVAALTSDNQFWRLTAQRILVEEKRRDAAPLLARLARGSGVAAVHGLWTLRGLGLLDRATHQAALLSRDSVVKRNAIEALGEGAGDQQLFFDTAVIADSDPHVRRVAFSKMARFPKSDMARRAVGRLLADPANRSEEWLFLALRNAAARQGAPLGERRWGENILENASFEEGDAAAPAGWRARVYQDRGGVAFSWDDSVARSGRRSAKIVSADGADASWSFHAAVKPNTDYRLSGWIKTGGLRGARGALFNVHSLNGAASESLRGNQDWTRVELVFRTDARAQVQINCLFGGWGVSQGAAWFDDMSLQEGVYVADNESATSPEGDAERGRIIVRTHPVASCLRCHRLDGEGGEVGPALDGLASRKERSYIRESLVNPQAAMAEGYPAQVSPMPPFGVLLAPQELEDVMAYLMTLRL